MSALHTYVVGVDPSSRKLAAVVTEGPLLVKWDIYTLPPKQPELTCEQAGDWMQDLVRVLRMMDYDPFHDYERNNVHVFIEAPVSVGAKGGVRAVIPQAQVSGALIHGAKQAGADIVMLVDNREAKKRVIGNGNASKSQMSSWVRHYWRNLWRDAKGDQDVCDAAIINRAGAQIEKETRRVAAGVTRRTAPKRLTRRRPSNATRNPTTHHQASRSR